MFAHDNLHSSSLPLSMLLFDFSAKQDKDIEGPAAEHFCRNNKDHQSNAM